ncbi:MATE family efflux transporter [Murimonas intestini]|uniref:MATE family efflux transporter n=1 Tax=Murimonas intestini TaxID=1337051 RepID=UPI0011DE20A3|nr:MATE family efflux transporter [Murimonas intestini]
MSKNSIEAMGSRPVLPLLLTMAFPPMISMLIQSMYNIVDSIFVAKLGESALTAVSLAFPLQNLVLSVAVGLGVGVNALMAKNLGAGDEKEAESAAFHGMVLTALHSLAFVFIGLFLTGPFFRVFTSDEQIYRMGCDYAVLVVSFSFGSLFHITIEKMFQATGNMIFPMLMQALGAVVNIILDPILIFGLLGFPALGVTGAAVATLIGQFTACGLSAFLFWKYGKIRLHLKGFRFRKKTVKNIYSIAAPSGMMNLLPSILVGTLNGILSAVSPLAVAVLGIYFKLQTFVYMPSNGLVQGMRPIISYNYGAGNKKRLITTIKMSCIVIGLVMLLGTAVFALMPSIVMQLFSAGEEMESMGIPALRIISAGFLISTLGVVFSGTFEALGLGFHSLIISLLRQFVITVPLALILMKTAGIIGVWAAFPIAEAVAAAVSILLFMSVYRNRIKTLLFNP